MRASASQLLVPFFYTFGMVRPWNSNPRPLAQRADALPTELSRRACRIALDGGYPYSKFSFGEVYRWLLAVPSVRSKTKRQEYNESKANQLSRSLSLSLSGMIAKLDRPKIRTLTHTGSNNKQDTNTNIIDTLYWTTATRDCRPHVCLIILW